MAQKEEGEGVVVRDEKAVATAAVPSPKAPQQFCILFYKYAPLTDDAKLLEPYRAATERLCVDLRLTGRVLLGLSNNAEGINGTLAGFRKEDVQAYVTAMLGRDGGELWVGDEEDQDDVDDDSDSQRRRRARKDAVRRFWDESESFSKSVGVPVVAMDSPDDFKWSTSSTTMTSGEEEGEAPPQPLFPDLRVKMVKEIIGTGGVLSSVTLDETRIGYLTPDEWHGEMKRLAEAVAKTSSTEQQRKDFNIDGGGGSGPLSVSRATSALDTVLIDCRNHKEYEIGHFEGALDPNTKTFEQFPRWVKENRAALDGKKVLMYCTGGIRCEKASAYIRKETDAASVKHLHGGIHKYLDRYGAEGLFRGKNFVFDRRGAQSGAKSCDSLSSVGANATAPDDADVVGRCLYCNGKYDTFTPDGVCTVCREPTLVCPGCRATLQGEYHCADHFHLRTCYYTDLSPYGAEELRAQLAALEGFIDEMAIGKIFKQKRRTLHRQCERVRGQLDELARGSGGDSSVSCRSCGGAQCDGGCWGFHGLGRKEKLNVERECGRPCFRDQADSRPKRVSSNQRASKVQQRERDIAEIRSLNLSLPPSSHRDPDTSLRCLPPVIRILQTSVKGKWCGESILSVLQREFADFSDPGRAASLFSHSLVRLKRGNKEYIICNDAIPQGSNGRYLPSSVSLKNMDVISRVIHWHEPPVVVPDRIVISKVKVPAVVCEELLPSAVTTASPEDEFVVYCCDKPSTVPVHPAGPYLANSLTLMVEGQEGLAPRSLLPCHRVDRVTSGLTLCCTSVSVARLVQGRMDARAVSKVYLARVMGRFPESKGACAEVVTGPRMSTNKSASWNWCEEENFLEVDAPIETIDAGGGIRAIRDSGKASKSRFRFLAYDNGSDQSLVACFPVTGRSHQLRVHLQWIGYPIQNDVQYGGRSEGSAESSLKRVAIEAVVKSASDAHETNHRGGFITQQEDAKAAAEVCKCCQGHKGVEDSFSSSQLLQSAHSIDLHALKYLVRFDCRKRKRRQASLNEELLQGPLATMEFTTNEPPWASSFRDFNIANIDLKIGPTKKYTRN